MISAAILDGGETFILPGLEGIEFPLGTAKKSDLLPYQSKKECMFRRIINWIHRKRSGRPLRLSVKDLGIMAASQQTTVDGLGWQVDALRGQLSHLERLQCVPEQLRRFEGRIAEFSSEQVTTTKLNKENKRLCDLLDRQNEAMSAHLTKCGGEDKQFMAFKSEVRRELDSRSADVHELDQRSREHNKAFNDYLERFGVMECRYNGIMEWGRAHDKAYRSLRSKVAKLTPKPSSVPPKPAVAISGEGCNETVIEMKPMTGAERTRRWRVAKAKLMGKPNWVEPVGERLVRSAEQVVSGKVSKVASVRPSAKAKH